MSQVSDGAIKFQRKKGLRDFLSELIKLDMAGVFYNMVNSIQKKAILHNSRNSSQRPQKEEKDEEFGSKCMAPISPNINLDL